MANGNKPWLGQKSLLLGRGGGLQSQAGTRTLAGSWCVLCDPGQAAFPL